MPIASKKYPSDGAFAGCQTFWESWYLHDRADRQDPLLAIEQRLIVDLRRDLSDKLSPDIDAGYAFNRFLGVGDGMGNTQ